MRTISSPYNPKCICGLLHHQKSTVTQQVISSSFRTFNTRRDLPILHSLHSDKVFMASQAEQLHFVLFPFMAQGHMIPMIDIARLLAKRGVTITIITTPLNAARFEKVLARASQSGLPIRVIQLKFPCEEEGMPEGCENFDKLPSMDLAANFFTAASMMQQQVEKLFEELMPKPSCIISDMCLPYTTQVAKKFGIPRIAFHGFSCFALLCLHLVRVSKVADSITDESEPFVVPGLPGHIEVTKAQLSVSISLKDFASQMLEAEMASYGAVINTFEELEHEYVKEYKKATERKIWCIGPVSQCNKENLDIFQRGNKASISEIECLNRLNSWPPGSVVYACLGSLCNLLSPQLIELGLGLEASNKPFIWVIRAGDKSKELEKWILENGFEERIKERGLLIRGWSPQLLILSHPAIGGFLTHCGWNSTLEGISAGLPLITWPLFAEQFMNEALVVKVLRIGVRIGVDVPMKLGEEEKIGVLVKKEDVQKAVDKLMNEGEEREERRKAAKELGKMAKGAIEKGGSSHSNLMLLIQDIMHQASLKKIN